MDSGRPQQQDKKQQLQQQQLLLQKQLHQQHLNQQLLKQQQINLQQQQLKPQQQLLQSQPNSQLQQQVLQTQPQYLQQQLPPNQQQLLIQNQDFMKQRSMQHGNLNQQQLLEHSKNQDQATIELLTLHDDNKYEDKNQEDCLILQRQQVIQQQQQPSLQRQQPLQQLQSQLMQQSQLGQQPQYHQQQSQILQRPQQQFQSVQQLQNVSQLQNLQQLQTVQQPQLITKAQVVQKTQVEHQPQVVRQPPAVQKPKSLQQSQIVQQQNNQYSPVSIQQQSKKQPPPHTQQLLQQQLQQLLLKNKNYPQRIVVLGNQPQQQQLLSQQPQRVVSNNSTGQQPQQMQCVVVTNTGQQSPQMQRVVVTGTSQQQQQQQIQRVMVGNNGQPQSQQMQRVVVTSTGQQVQQQQLQHVIIPGTSQQQSHQVQNVVTQTSIQQQPQQLQRVVVTPTSQQQVQRVVTSTPSQQQQQITQQHQPVSQRIVIGQLKTSQLTQQMQSSSQNGVVLNQQVTQRPIGSIQQQQRVVVAGQQQILKLANQQQSQQQITLQKQLAHKLLQPTHQQQQQDVVKNQQQQLDVINQYQQQEVLKNQQKQLDIVKNKHRSQGIVKKQQQQQNVVKKLQQQQDLVKTQLQQGQISQGIVVSLTQQQKNNLDLSNEILANKLHIKQSYQQLQQLHIQPSQKDSQEQINKQLQQQKLKQKKEIDKLKHQLKQSQRSGVQVGQLQQPEKPEPEKLKRQLEIQQQQRQNLQERLLLQERQQQQQQKLKEKQLQQKHQQQLREQVLLQQHFKQQQQQEIQKTILLKQQASSENRLSLVVNGIQDQKIRDEEKTINSHEISREPQPFREIENATGAEKQYEHSIKRNYNENLPVSENKLLLSSSSSDDDDDDNTMRKQRNLVREAERLVQERYDALKVVLGSKYQDQYDDILRNWLANRLSREEFDREIRKVLYISWGSMTKNVNGDNNKKNASIKTNNTTSKKTVKKESVATISKIKEDNGSLINSSTHKSPTSKKAAETNEDIDFNIEKKEVKDILSERVPLHNALVTSLLTWLPLNCQWLENRKAISQGVSETGSPLRLYTYADVPQARGPSDHWYPNVAGSLAHWFWPNNLPCKSSLVENDEYPIPKLPFYEQEKKEVADAVAAAVLINPPSSKLLPLLMEVAENKEKVRRARQLQYQKRFPKKQNAKVTKRLQLQRLQEHTRLDIMVQLRNTCSKLLPELKKRLRCLADQESRLIERLRRLKIRMSRRRRQVLAQFKIREKDLQFRIRKFFDRSYLEEPNIDFKEHLHTDDSTIEDDETDDDEKDNEKESQQNVFKHWKEVNLLEKNHGKKQLKTTIPDCQSKRYVRAQRPQSTTLTMRLLRDRQRFLATTRLLQVTKQERLQISSNVNYVRKVRNKNCPCGESYNKPCQYRRQIRHLRKKLRARKLAAIKEKIDQELVRKAADKEKVDAEELQKTTAIEIEKRKDDTHNKKVVTKSTKKKKPKVIKKNFKVEAEEKKNVTTAKGKTVDRSLVKTNAITDISTSKKTTSLVTTNTKNIETMVRQTLDNLDGGNKGKQNIGINCELLLDKSPQQARFDSLADTRNRIRPPPPKDKRSVVNVADAAARAAQAALAASKKTQLRKTRAAVAAAAAAASATCAGTVSSSRKDDNDRRASELMPPPPPPPPMIPTAPSKTVTIPKNPSNGARYLQQQQYLLDRHRQLERIRRDEEERRQRAQDEQQEQEGSDREDDETNVKMEDVSSSCLPSSQRMISKRQKVPVGIIRPDINRDNDKEDQEEFSSVNRSKAKNREESQQLSDYYFYYGGGDYYSSDEESGSSFIEPPFPPLLHDLRIDQLPRPTNRLPAAAILPPGVRTRLQPIRLSNSKIDAVESSVEKRQERTILETDHGRNINDLVNKEAFDYAMDFRMQNPLNSYVVSNTCKAESADKMSAQKKCRTVNKELQTELVLQRGQQQMQQGRINDTKILLEQRKRRQNADKLPEAKKTFEQIQQERQKNGKPILKTNPLTEWSKQDSKQVTTSSVTKTNSYNKDQSKKHLVNNQLQQQNSDNKMIGSVSSNRGQEPDTRVDVEELRSVQWKAPLTQWNKRPVTYEAAVTQRYPIQNKVYDSQNSLKEKLVTYTSAKFEVSNHHLNDRQHKLRSEIDKQKFKRIEMKNMVLEYQKLVDTLPQNEQLQHMAQLQRYLRPPGNIIEKTTVKCNPSVEKQQQPPVTSTKNSCILLDNSTSLLNLLDDGQERIVLKQIGNLLLKIKNQQEEMYQNVISDEIKRFPKVVSNKLEINNVEENDLKNWHDLWPAYEGKPNNDELMNEEERLRRTQELINRYYSCNNDQKSVRSLDQQKRRLGRYGRERLERELPAYQQLRMTHRIQSETSARSNLTEQQILKLQHTEQHSPERQKYLEQYRRLGRIEQLEQQKRLLGDQQQQLNEQKIQQLQNKQQQDSNVERSSIQQQGSQHYFMVSKFVVSSTLCYDEELPLHDQLLRRIVKKKYEQLIKVIQQQQRSKSTTVPITVTLPDITIPENTSNANTMRQTSRGSQLWWRSIGLERQISPLVTGIDNQVDLEVTHVAVMPISNLPQVTRPQIDSKVATVVEVKPKVNTVATNKIILQNWMEPHLISMMTNNEGKWLEQLQSKISQLDQQVDLHWKAMINKQEQQVQLLLDCDKHLQWEKEKKRLERERRIQQLKKRTPFQALPVHHQQAHTLRAAGHMQQQQSEIPIIVIDDDDDIEPLHDTTIVGQKHDTHQHPVFIDDDLLQHKIETKILYEDQHKGISNRWKQLEIIRRAHQKQWKSKLKQLFSYKTTNRQFCRKLYERMMSKIENPNLIKALEYLNGEPLKYSERQQFQQQMGLSEPQPTQEQPRMLHHQKDGTQKQAAINRSQRTPIKQKKHKTAKSSKKTIKQQRSIQKLALQHPLNKQGYQKLEKQLPQNLINTNKNQPKKSYEHQESINIRKLRSKKHVVVSQPSQPNNLNQNKLKKSSIEQHKQVTRRRFQRGQLLKRVKTPAMSSRHMFLLRNRILQVHSNRNKRLRQQKQRLVPKQNIIIDTREMQIQKSQNKFTKLVLKTMAYSLYNQRSSLQRQLERLNETHPDKIDNQLEPSVSKTLIMSVQKPSITSMILSPQQQSTIKQQSLTSTLKLCPQRPSTSIEQPSMSSVMLISHLPMQPYQPTASTSANQQCQQSQEVEEKRQALKQKLNKVHSKLKPLMEMWQLSNQLPGRWLLQQLDDIEQLRQKEVSVRSMLDLRSPSVQQQKQHILQNNEVSVVIDSTTITMCSLQQLQRIREHLNWRQQRLRDLIEDLLILICPEQHPMLSDTTQLSSNCSVLIKLQKHPIMMEPINSAYSAILNLQSPSSSKHTQQQFSTYSLLLKLNQPMMTKQQSLMYSTVLKLQQPLMQKQTSCRPMMITSQQPSTSRQQPSIAFVSKNIIHNPSPSSNKCTQRHNNQLQEKRRLSIEDETNDNCKRLKSSSKKRSKAPSDSITYKRSVTSRIKNTGIDKSLPIISLVDSDDDIETLDSDSSTESSNEASFGVQVSEKSPLTIKIIKKKPPPGTSRMITDIENNSEIHNMSNIDSNKGLELTKNKYFNKDKTIQIDVNRENLKKLISTKDEDNKTLINEQNNIKDVMTGSVLRTIVGRPTQIAVNVNRPKETLAVMNKPSMANDNNQILKIAVVECSSTMISNVANKCINVEPDGRNTIKMMGGVINSKYNNSVDRTISVINKLSEAAVSVIRRTPMVLAQNNQPAVDQIPTPIITPTEKSNMKMTKSIDQSQSCNNSTENTINIKKSRAVTPKRLRQIGTLSKTVRRYRRLNRTLSSETRGPAVFTFRDHGFAQGTIEQIIHGRFVTTILTMTAAHTSASYIPPSLPRIPFDYASMYQYNCNVASTNNNEDNTTNSQNIKLANTPVTPLSSIMSWIEKNVKISSNIACGNGHVWKGCARVSGPTLMTLNKKTKEAIARKNDNQSRATSPISNSNEKQQINTERSTSPTSIATPSSLEIMTTSYTPSTKNVAGLSSSLPSVELHNGSKSTIEVASPSRKRQSNSVVQPTKRSALEAFSSVPSLTSKITTDIVVPALETKMSTSAIVVRPEKRSKSAVTTANTSTVDVSPTLTKPSQREELHKSVKRSASVAGYASSPITSKKSDLSPPAVKPPKRSKSAVVITPVLEADAASSNIQSRSIKRSASMALSPPSVRQTNKSKSTVPTSFNKNSTIQSKPTLANATIPEPRVSRTLNILKTMPPAEMSAAAPNDTKNNVFNNAVFETGDQENTTYQKTTTITDEDQRTVTVTRTLCPAIPAPMDVTADACSLVTAACEQFIKAMVMERHLKAGRGAGTLQLRRRDAFAAAIAVDDEIRPFPDYCRTPVIETTTVNPVISAYTQRENNDVEKGTASEQKSVITDSKYNTKSIVMMIDKPDHENERRAVLKQQSIIADCKSKNKLSVLTVKTVIETQTTSSTTTTINKLQCPTTITTDSNAKTRSSRSVVKGTSARTRGAVIFKKTRSSMSTSELTMPSSSDQPTISNQLSAEPTAARKRSMSPPPFIAPNTTVKPPVFGEATNELLKLPFNATLTFNSSMSTRGFFVHRGGPLNDQPAFNRRQPFGKLIATCTMAAANSTAANNVYFSDNRGQNLDTKDHWLYDDAISNVWGCYLSNPKMLPPLSRFNNFFNTADELEVPSSENHDGGNGFSDDDDTGHLIPSIASTKLLHDMVKANGNNIQEQISLANSRQKLILMDIACQQQQMEQLENEMKWRVQEYRNGKPDSQKMYYKKFQKLQYGSSNPPEHSILRFSSNGHSRHSLMSW